MAMIAATTAHPSTVLAGPPSASRTPPVIPGNAVLGSLAIDADRASDSAAQPPPKKRRVTTAESATTSQGLTEPPGRRVDILSGEAIPAARFSPNRATGRGKLLTQSWISGSPPGMPGTALWAADTMITGSRTVNIFQTARNKGIKKLILYSGADGRPDGDNWDMTTGQNKYPNPSYFTDDGQTVADHASAFGIQTELVDVGRSTRSEMKHLLSRDGVHVLLYCFSAADEVVMEVLGVRHVTVYEDRIQCV
ncbi:hypothetical protein [Luteibacter sp.]|jgi:hypothetical protein|uniref:hypothetical protein n=1 Tax=Luteibacter sp. TaxID=1886636 RepID=UPI002F427947